MSRPALNGSLPTVIYLGRNLKVGGAERIMVHYLNGADRVRPVGVLLDARGGLLSEVSPDVPLHGLSRRPSEVPGDERASGRVPGTDSEEKWKIFREAWRLSRLVRDTGATVLSSFLMRSHMVAFLARELWCPDIRLVFNVHSMILHSERHLYPDPFSRWTMRAFLRHGFRRADRIIAVADGVAAELRGHLPFLDGRLRVVHNPVDVDTIRRRAREGPRLDGLSGQVVVAVGRMIPLKGFDLLLDAMARIDPHGRPHVVFVGDGPERQALTAQARELGLASRVHMVGRTPNPWSYIAQATALVVPSRTEAFPNVIGEALVLGVPVIATTCAPGIREYLQDGACGVLVPPDDAGALASTLSSTLADASLRARLVEAGRRRVSALAMASKVEAYEQTLLEVLGG